MIFYKNILGKLAYAGYNTNRLRQEHILSESAINRLRHNEPINICTLDLACKLTGLPVEELIEYREDPKK